MVLLGLGVGLALGSVAAAPVAGAGSATARDAAVGRAAGATPRGGVLVEARWLARPSTRAASAHPEDGMFDDAQRFDDETDRAVEGEPGATATPWPIRPPARTYGATTALVVQTTTAYARAGSGKRIWRVPAETTWSKQPMILLVTQSAVRGGRRWLKVALPKRPSGSFGWIAYDDVVLGRTNSYVEVFRGSRSVRVWQDGQVVRRFRAVVGAPRTPTPRGLAAVYERNRQRNPRAFLGPWAIALTATSNVLQEFDGGPGRIGLHGRAGASFRDPLGSARSHGCVRVTNADIAWLASHVPQGAPVEVR